MFGEDMCLLNLLPQPFQSITCLRCSSSTKLSILLIVFVGSFCWEKVMKRDKIHTMKWREIFKPIGEGGLGLERQSNKWTTLAKSCWRCISDSNLLYSKFLKAKYCPKGSLWAVKFRKGKPWFCKGFVEGVNLINNKVECIIDNGDRISVWNCYWIPCKDGFGRPQFNIVNPNLTIKNLWSPNKN